MAATVQIYRYTGAGADGTNITSINTRVNAADVAYTNETTNPITIPGIGLTNYSYWCITGLVCTVTPTTLIDNIIWFTDGVDSFGTGIGCAGYTATSYVQATGTPGVTGAELTVATYATLDAEPVDVFVFNAGSPLIVDGSIANPATGDFGSFVVYQFSVANSAVGGGSGTETFQYQFDES